MTQYAIERLSSLGPIVTERMADSIALYLDDRRFGLIRNGTVYFRTTDETVHRYVSAGSRPCAIRRDDGETTVLTDYHEVPVTVLCDDDLVCAWAYEATDRD